MTYYKVECKKQGFGAEAAWAGVFGWRQSRSRHFGPVPAPPYSKYLFNNSRKLHGT